MHSVGNLGNAGHRGLPGKGPQRLFLTVKNKTRIKHGIFYANQRLLERSIQEIQINDSGELFGN